jgi:iron complex outermembrane recepter protein
MTRRHNRPQPRSKIQLLAVAIALAMLPAAPVWAQQAATNEQVAGQAEQRYQFNIPAKPLPQAIADFSAVTGVQVLYTEQNVAEVTAPALNGSYTASEALQRLLAGSDFTFRFSSPDAVTLVAAQDGDGPVRTGPITVEGTLVGTRIGETAEESSASVQVFTGEQLEERPDTQEVRDLFNKTANVLDIGEDAFAPTIRGQDGTGPANAGTAFIAGTRPRTTLTVDGRPLSAFELVGGPTSLWDVQQVEIYRGPQTTLQGRNSIAGAFVVETKAPTFFWESKLRAMVGTEDRHRMSAMVSGPLTESLAFRATVDYLDAESFVDFTGPQGVDDPEEDESLTVRGKLLFAPEAVPEFTAQLTFAHTDTRRPQGQRADRPFDERENEFPIAVFETESDDVILDLEYAFSDRLILSNTTTYGDILFERVARPDIGLFELDGPQVTNETLLNLTDPNQGLKGVLGFYVFHEDRDDAGFIDTPRAFTFDDKTLTTAIFGELEWEFVDSLRATLGGRYEREKRERQGSAFGIDIDLDETFDAFLPKAGLAWDVAEQVTVGAVVSRGFNAGGAGISFGAFDAVGNPSPDPALGSRSFVFDSEFVWNYELFARARLLDDRLFLTGNLFFSDFEDQQRTEVLTFPGGFSDEIIVNTPESQSYGAELGIEYAPSEKWDLFANIGLLSTDIEQTRDPRIEGNDFARAPNFTTSFGVNLRPTPNWQIGLDARYIDDYFSFDANDPVTEVDGFLIANAQVAWRATRHLRFTGTVTNLFDNDAETRFFSSSLANVVEPRVFWFGAELGF